MSYVYFFAHVVYAASAYTSPCGVGALCCFMFVVARALACLLFIVCGVSAYGFAYGSGLLVSALCCFMFIFGRGVACLLLIISFTFFCFACFVDDSSDQFLCSCMFPTIVFLIANE